MTAKSDACPHCGVHHRSLTADECADRAMSERTLQSRVVGRAKRRGWLVAHAGRGIAAFTKDGEPVFLTQMSKGWPDLFMLHKKAGRVLVIECKKEMADLEPDQIAWMQAFLACGIPAVMVKPSDLRLGRVSDILGVT